MTTPNHFCNIRENIKAFVLGCDPTAFNKDHKRLEFQKAFGLENKNNPYFAGILSNLELFGITLNNIYV
jgi:hypothetical protein